MFQRILHRAESAIEASIGSAVAKGLAVTPFFVAAGFGAVALSHYLTPRYGPEIANLILAAIFAGIGVIAMIAAAYKYPANEDVGDTAAVPPRPARETGEGGSKMAEADKDLLYSALAAMAPVALPRVAGVIVRNLPLIAAVLGAAYLASRSVDNGAQQASAAPPAE